MPTLTEPAASPDPAPRATPANARVRGLWLGLLGVACFSLTPTATRAAVAAFDPFFVATGRALGAAALAGALLAFTRQPWPAREQIRGLLPVIAGVVLGFPLLLTWALGRTPATHAAAVLGLLPLGTAVAGTLRSRAGGEGAPRPSARFWLAALAGSGIVTGFACWEGGGSWQAADWALAGAVVAAAVGYTEGARVSRTLGGWQTISWALVLAAPLEAALVAWFLPDAAGRARLFDAALTPASAWAGFAYATVVSQFLGFFPWYAGLALGGVARVGQLQLLMPFMTIGASALLLGERITPATAVTAALVCATVAVGWGAKR